MSLPLNDKDIIPALGFKKTKLDKNFYLLVNSLYKKFPNSDCWDIIKKDQNDFCVSKIKPCVIAYGIIDLLSKPHAPTIEKQISEDVNFIYKDYSYGKSVEREIYSILFKYFESTDEETITTFSRAVVFNCECISYFFQKSLVQKPEILIPIIRTILSQNNNWNFRKSIEEFLTDIFKKEQAVIFIKECEQVSEPLRTLLLRGTQTDFYRSNENVILLKEAFIEIGLDVNAYPPLEENIWDNVLNIHKFCLKLKSIQDAEQLDVFCNKISSLKFNTMQKVLRALNAGIIISENLRIESSLEKEVIHTAITKKGLNPKQLETSLNLNELAKDDMEEFTSIIK